MDFTTHMAESLPMAPESPTPRGPHRALASVTRRPTHGAMAHSPMACTAHTAPSPTPRGPHRALASVMRKPTHGATLPSTTASTAHTASEWLVTLAPLSPTPRGPHRVLARGQPPRPRPLPRPPTLARPPHTLA